MVSIAKQCDAFPLRLYIFYWSNTVGSMVIYGWWVMVCCLWLPSHHGLSIVQVPLLRQNVLGTKATLYGHLEKHLLSKCCYYTGKPVSKDIQNNRSWANTSFSVGSSFLISTTAGWMTVINSSQLLLAIEPSGTTPQRLNFPRTLWASMHR